MSLERGGEKKATRRTRKEKGKGGPRLRGLVYKKSMVFSEEEKREFYRGPKEGDKGGKGEGKRFCFDFLVQGERGEPLSTKKG